MQNYQQSFLQCFEVSVQQDRSARWICQFIFGAQQHRRLDNKMRNASRAELQVAARAAFLTMLES